MICSLADPSPWLEVKPHIKTKNCMKPYDDKKSAWVPNPKGEFGGYLEGITENVLLVADWEAVGESSKRFLC